MTMWADKLRNTRYIQGFGRFGDDFRRCSMGVIDGVDNSESHANLLITDNSCVYTYSSPTDIQIMSKCSEHNIIFSTLGSYVIHLNDAHRLSFNQIADIIEPIELEHRMEVNAYKKVCA